MMFLKMMLPIACLGAQESPSQRLQRAQTLAGMSFETREVDLMFRTDNNIGACQVPARINDARAVAGFGWHECIGGVPTFLQRWYAETRGYGKLLTDVTEVFAEYRYSQSQIRQGNGGSISRVFEKFSQDGNTAYLFVRRLAPGRRTTWDVEEYRRVQGNNMSAARVLRKRTLYRQTSENVLNADGVFSWEGPGLGSEPSTTGQFERQVAPEVGASDVTLAIYPYINRHENENQMRREMGRGYGRESLLEHRLNNRGQLPGMRGKVSADEMQAFSAQWHKRNKQNEDTKALLRKIIIREFNIRARRAGKLHMLPELMQELRHLDRKVEDLFSLTHKYGGLVDIDFDQLEVRTRTYQRRGTDSTPAAPWGPWERVNFTIDTNKTDMRNGRGQPSNEFPGDGNLYYRTGQKEFRLRQRFGFPFGLRISRRKLTEEKKRSAGIYAPFTSIEDERERSQGAVRCTPSSKPKPSSPRKRVVKEAEEQKMQSRPDAQPDQKARKVAELKAKIAEEMKKAKIDYKTLVNLRKELEKLKES